MKSKTFILFVLLLLVIPLSTSADFGYNNPTLPKLTSSPQASSISNITTVNNITNYINSTYWNLSGTSLFPQSLGYNVSIGTTSPTHKLTVNGDANITGTTYTQAITPMADIAYNAGGTANRFNNIYTQFLFASGLRANAYNDLDNAVSILVHSGTTNSFYDGAGVVTMQMTPDRNTRFLGNVNMSNELYVKNGTAVSPWLYNQTYGGSTFNSTYAAIVSGVPLSALAWDNSSTSIFIRSGFPTFLNVNDALYVNGSSGNVGIGTANPVHKVAIVGKFGVNSTLNLTETTYDGNIMIQPQGYQLEGQQIRLSGASTQGIAFTSTSVSSTPGTVSFNGVNISLDPPTGTPITIGNWIVNVPGQMIVDATPSAGFNPLTLLVSPSHATDMLAIGNSTLTNKHLVLNKLGYVGIDKTTPGSRLEVNGNVSLNSTLFVTTKGDVGIGTTAPTNKLTVQGGDIYINGTNYLELGDGTVAIRSDKTTSGSLEAYTGNTLRMTINGSTGEVAIGNSTPQSTLDVQGASTKLLVNSNLAGEGSGRYLVFKSIGSSGEHGLILQSSNAGERMKLVSDDATGDIIFQNSWAPYGIQFKTQTSGVNNTRMYLKNNGQLGIGNSTPSYLLHVQGNASLNDSLFVKTTGNVGIGTNLPVQRLNVVGNTNLTQNLTIGQKISNYNNDKTEGNGVVSIVNRSRFYNISSGSDGDITYVMWKAPIEGEYRFSTYAVTTVPAALDGNIVTTFNWEDETGTQSFAIPTFISLSVYGSTAYGSNTVHLRENGQLNVTYTTTGNLESNSQYSAYTTVERLS